MPRKIRIADWLVHGGHQYEFFKSNNIFLCTNPDGTTPHPSHLGRPANRNVRYVSSRDMLRSSFDIIMVRAGVNYTNVSRKAIRYNIPGIAVMQTFLPYPIPKWVRCVVWNSLSVMERYKGQFSDKKHFYIPHGFDPYEFCNLFLERNGKALSAASLFKQRKKVMGYDEWRWVADKTRYFNLLGHGNDDIPESIGSFALDDLVHKYNEYSVFLNTTTKSAMPRTRAEALMCGTPIVSTKNFGIERYLTHKLDCYFANNKYDMLKYCNDIIKSKNLQEDLSEKGRETAKKYFHIKDYLSRWEEAFEGALR